MKKKLLALLMGTSLVLAACGGGDEAGGGDTAGADPEKLYNQKCSSCHGGDLEGGAGPKLSDVGSRLSQEEIESVIANGQGSMPPKMLEGEEASAVAEWLANKK
ncbi:cytochrome c551 [Mesobacillus selenatarsenatis]|uniref:Cytochrome c551 n=1 Tax=Mesobacillus selenatarsenatis (strain DSM 18680 / JCM 14380 / FERM P-15431 / SF-1) TaxID=1321606 RepID=A0A0A8WWK1_MESS1|nr:cytochrome c [Mesobacillus selenatarsenatis]GAM11978.1 cytochrome c551 [Mesobacillus selenatarsenatis SF-1]